MTITHLVPDTVRELLEGSGSPYGRPIWWRGHRFEVAEVICLTPSYWQVLLKFMDETDRLPVSVPAHDLVDAVLA